MAWVRPLRMVTRGSKPLAQEPYSITLHGLGSIGVKGHATLHHGHQEALGRSLGNRRADRHVGERGIQRRFVDDKKRESSKQIGFICPNP